MGMLIDIYISDCIDSKIFFPILNGNPILIKFAIIGTWYATLKLTCNMTFFYYIIYFL